MLTLSLLLHALPAPAWACGGFFCQQVPVEQAAERILFAIDEDKGRVDVHVQISYEGRAEDFAWVVPTPAEPVLRVTVDDVFQRLAGSTSPTWALTQKTIGKCAFPFSQRLAGTMPFGGSTDDASQPPQAPYV